MFWLAVAMFRERFVSYLRRSSRYFYTFSLRTPFVPDCSTVIASHDFVKKQELGILNAVST